MGLISMVFVPFMKQILKLNIRFARKQSWSQAENVFLLCFLLTILTEKEAWVYWPGGRDV